MKESKSDRFRRVAEARVNKLIKMLRLLGNCSMSTVYVYDNDQVEQIFSKLQIELDQARQRYCGERQRKRFSLSEAQNPASDTISHPHITLILPNGQLLRAVAYAQDEYPAINVYLLKDDLSEELICFAEFNQERASGHEVCIGAYQSDDDEPKYYASYEEERNQDENPITDADTL